MSDSPAKKLNFELAGKENDPIPTPLVDADLKKPNVEVMKSTATAPKVALGIKESEADEPLLQENPHRFVLFPLKYHEVSRYQQRVTRKVLWN
jgi:ribonucleoside-diphosphate reductase subunit M2